jgi:hypothetical protein
MCVYFPEILLLCLVQNNSKIIGIFSLYIVHLSNFANFLEKFTKLLIS